MILTALHNLYGRLSEKNEVLPMGFSKEKISYAIVISTEGEVVDVEDIRVTGDKNKKPRPQLLAVPQSSKRPGNISPFFLWDNSSYVLGVAAEEKNKQRTLEQHQAFREKIFAVTAKTADEGLLALDKIFT